MVEHTYQMANYEAACKAFEENGIAYKELGVDGYRVTFELSKDGASGRCIIDCESAQLEQQLDFIIKGMEQTINFVKLEAKRNEKKQKQKRN